MVTVKEAFTIVLANVPASAITQVPIEQAVGRTLAEVVVADRNFPPIDRVTMDGIAISFDSWSEGKREFEIEGVCAAGAPQQSLRQRDNCLEIMTGAPLPTGTDTIIPYESLQIEARRAKIETGQVSRGQNLHRMGSDARAGENLLHPGTVMTPAEVAILALVGKQSVKVFDFPRTAIISTGDELVNIDERPAPHQLRRSNTYAILAAMKTMGWHATPFHLPDQQDVINGELKAILTEYDTVILSGGVSKGKFDFIPATLESNNIVKKFHRVNQRPGKPFWFGTSADGKKTVFALPGNPVATYLCFYRYVRPWMRKQHQVDDVQGYAILAHDFEPPRGMTYFLQVVVKNERGVLMAYPDAGGGSGDLANLKDVTGFLELPDSIGTATKGQVFSYFPFRA